MFHLIYFSGETTRFETSALENLLLKSRERNADLAITGLLLYKHGNFMQILEGEEDAVCSLYEAIRVDKRHRRVIRLLHESIPERDFPGWSMAYAQVCGRSGDITGGDSDILGQPWDPEKIAAFPNPVRSHLRAFIAATH